MGNASLLDCVMCVVTCKLWEKYASSYDLKSIKNKYISFFLDENTKEKRSLNIH